MSKCISINGEYSEHEPSNQEFVCGRCFAFDEDAVVAEVDSLRQKLVEAQSAFEEAADWFAMRTEVESLREQLACYSDQEDRIQYLAEQLADRDAEVAELVHQRGKLLDIAQEANDDCKRWRSLLAARDALIESQARQIAALAGSIQDINPGWDETLEQLAEREAVIDAVDDWFNGLGDAVCPDGERLARLLDASPSAVLAEHDARVLEDLIGRLVTVGWGRSARDWLRKRAAEYRKGAGQ